MDEFAGFEAGICGGCDAAYGKCECDDVSFD